MATTNKDLLLVLKIRGTYHDGNDQQVLRRLMPVLLDAIGWENADNACTFTSYQVGGKGMCRADVEITVGPGANAVKTVVLLHIGASFQCGTQVVDLKKGGDAYLDMPGVVYRDIMSRL